MSDPERKQSGDAETRPLATDAGATADDELLAALAEEFAARARRQERPTMEEYVARHPRLEDRIRKVLPAIALMEATRSFDPAAAAYVERPGSTIGRYKLLERIGEGGFGVVYLADQLAPVRRKVALKVLKPGMDSRQVLARFEAERQALAVMDHPNIAKVFDGGVTDGGRPYFVMELVKGVPITEFCDQHQLTPRQRLELFEHVCQAVQHAHTKGIIHRDIKPSNVLVTMHDTTPVVKVIDFGIAKALGQELTDKTLFTGFAQLLGTPLYMSPEQAGQSGLDVDTRSDIYSLGVLLYELLTGTTPFDKERFKRAAHDEIRRIIKEEEPPRPSTRLSESKERLPSISAQRHTEPAKLTRLVRGELDWIVMKALEKDRNRRYETVNGLAMDVQRYLADESVLACPPSVGYRLRKFARRYKAQVVTAALVFVALLAGLVATSYGLYRADVQRRRAEGAERTAVDNALAATKAAAAEKAAREQTQKRLAQIEKGVELFAGMLSGINPRSEELGSDPLYVQLRKRAEQAADQLDAEAVGDPLAVARLQTILGNTLRELGGSAKAVDLLEKARASRERELGADHADTLTSANDLACAYYAAGQLDEALPLHAATVKAREAKLGTDHPDTLDSRNNLATAYLAVGQLDKALPLLEATLTVREARLGANHPDTLESRNNLASAFLTAGQPDKALPLVEATLRAAEVTLGTDHPDTLESRNNLASAFLTAGQLGKALPLLEATLKACEAKLGAGHRDTLRSRSNLAGAYRAAGQPEKALPLLEATLRECEVNLGADHPDTLTSRNNLAVAYQTAGQHDKALPLFEQAAAGIEKRRFQHEHAARIISNTIAGYEGAGQLDEAGGWRRKWLANIRDQAGPTSLAYAVELAGMGSNLMQQWGWAEAEPLLRECLTIREAQQPDAWTTFNTQSMLGGALLNQKKTADAEALLLTGYAGMKQRETTIPPEDAMRLSEALDWLIELYTVTDRPEEAKKWQAERAKYPVAASDPSVLARARHYARLSEWEEATGGYERAGIAAHRLSDDTFAYACLFLMRGDEEGYERVCLEMIRRVGQTPSPWEGFILGRTCAIARKGPVDPARAVEWASLSVVTSPQPWNYHVLGLAQYRAGRFDKALECFTKSGDEGFWPHRDLNWFGLALVHHSLDNPDEARRCLNKGIQWLEREGPPGPDLPTKLLPQDWLAAQLLRREAEELLEAAPPKQGGPDGG